MERRSYSTPAHLMWNCENFEGGSSSSLTPLASLEVSTSTRTPQASMGGKNDARWKQHSLCNGEVLAQGAQFSLNPVEVTTTIIDLEQVRSYRSSISRNVHAAAEIDFPRIECDLRLSRPAEDLWFSDLQPSHENELKIMDPIEEIHMSTAVLLWQYLCRTNSPGYFIALSGGLDSSTVALFVHGMAKLVL